MADDFHKLVHLSEIMEPRQPAVLPSEAAHNPNVDFRVFAPAEGAPHGPGESLGPPRCSTVRAAGNRSQPAVEGPSGMSCRPAGPSRGRGHSDFCGEKFDLTGGVNTVWDVT